MKDKYSIIGATTTQYQLECNGVHFWVQNRWLRKDGTLTAKGLEIKRDTRLAAEQGIRKETLYSSVPLKARELVKWTYLIESTNGTRCYIPCDAIFSADVADRSCRSFWIAEVAMCSCFYRPKKRYIWR